MVTNLHFGQFNSQEFTTQFSTAIKDRKVLLLVDENTHELCFPVLTNYLDGLSGIEIVELPSGEENKTLDYCLPVWETLTECQFSRNDVLVVLGGGVLCDMGGLIAGLYKRGMTCILIPTTLLSMVDASVGGKTGVDLGPFKNQLGIFREPAHIFIDPQFLQTLPSKELQNGLAEMLKHALIEGDLNYFTELLNHTDLANLDTGMIEKSIRSKKEIVDSDPFEKGKRKLLNLGHTVAHAIEGHCLSLYPIDHGLAVAHGLLIEANISKQMGKLNNDEYQFLSDSLSKIFEWRTFDSSSIEQMIELMKNDKKNSSSEPEFVLLETLKLVNWSVKVPLEIIKKAMQEVLLAR
ncbi:MAG: 3-dehydroquinate synthase [Bacteroidetes bacterium]|nr:3-dehydroquinate synthase [Bacteroidota bacterium]